MITSTSKLLVVAAAAACAAALAQPTDQLVPIEPEQRLLGQVEELRAEQGLNAEGLVEPLRGLALLYQEAGDHALAAATLEEARQVLRANHGLHSATVDEALVLQQQIHSERALGNGERVWNLQYDLINIARQHLDDMRMLPVFRELIDDRTERLDVISTTAYRELPPGLFVPCDPSFTPPGAAVPVLPAQACAFGTWRMVVARLHGAVLRNYADAIAVLIRNGDYASPELRDLEKQALSFVPFERGFIVCSIGTFTEFLESELVHSCLDTAGGGGPVLGRWASVGGWASLMRLAYYEVRSGAPAAARANAFAELGDWYLRADHVSQRRKFSTADSIALELYERAFAELRQVDDAAESMAEIFSPELPVTLPTYSRNLLASVESSRFIDIAFAITKYGESEQIEVLDSSENATRLEERGLMRLIKYASFRPRAMDGELADSAPVVVRYYLPENPSTE
jgi:hypothetical protein